MTELVAALESLGFTLNEARAYAALLGRGPSTGYEVGQYAGIPRSAVYAVLRKLVDASAARSIKGRRGEPERFVATPVDGLVMLLRRRFDGSTEALENAARALAPAVEAPDAFTVRGYDRVLEEATRLVTSAQDRLVLSGWPRELSALIPVLVAARDRGVFIVVFAHAALPPEMPGEIFSYGLVEADLEAFWRHRLVVVADDARALVGATEGGVEDNAVVSGTAAIAELAVSQVALDVTLLSQRSGRDVQAVMARMLGDRVGRLDRLL
ncbi:MAG: TrmB family transcriptional regulator [Myxococcales bacterium]|nr:TrmB family transcriptional regulator [Myxococcales bacterium]